MGELAEPKRNPYTGFMPDTLSNFIANRLADLTAKEKPLREQLNEVVREIEQLQRAADAAGIVVNGAKWANAHDVVAEYSRRSVPEKTIKEAVLTVLRDYREGLTALEILERINALLKVNYPRTSLSPQLSRLKADGRIERHGTSWRLLATPDEAARYPVQTDLEDALK